MTNDGCLSKTFLNFALTTIIVLSEKSEQQQSRDWRFSLRPAGTKFKWNCMNAVGEKVKEVSSIIRNLIYMISRAVQKGIFRSTSFENRNYETTCLTI